MLDHPILTKPRATLLFYWKDEARDNKLFSASQIEALETLMYINEVAEKAGRWIINELKKAGREANPGLYRLAFEDGHGFRQDCCDGHGYRLQHA